MRNLGHLEAAIMDVLWRAEVPLRVRDVRERLAPSRSPAYTTVMTVLDNLFRKGLVQREMDGKAYRYEPVNSRADAAVQALREVLAETGDPEGVLLHFARSASRRELRALRKALNERSGQ